MGQIDLFTDLRVSSRRSLACLELPAFGLQLLLSTRPGWRELPAVVIDEDRPQGLLLAANAQARALGVHPGQRYAHALGLCRELRAAVVPPPTLGAGVAHIVSILRGFSPHIEPSPEEPGVFWLDTSGLSSLYGTLSSWALAVIERLLAEGFAGFIATGFSRFGTYASAKSLSAGQRDVLVHADRIRIVTSASAERDLAAAVPLDYLRLPPRLRERLGLLSIRTLGELAELPRAGLVRRFGPEVLDLVTGLHGERESPLAPTPETHRLTARRLLDYVEHDATRLLTHLEGLLDELWPALARPHGHHGHDRRVAALTLTLGREGRRGHGGKAGGSVRETLLEDHHLRPAVPTRERALLLDLVRLRLEALQRPVPASSTREAAPSGFVLVALELHDAPAEAEQGLVFAAQATPSTQSPGGARPARDTAAAARALARVTAELGLGRVALIAPRDGHLPRTRQVLVAIPPGPLRSPEPGPLIGAPPLVRRLHRAVLPMPPRPRDLKSGRNDGWPARLLAQGPIVEVSTPSIVSGGWWGGPGVPGGTRHEVHREYLYAETRRGDLVWIYYDRRRRRWLEEGVVG